MECPNCGAFNPDSAGFCSLCLARFSVEPEAPQPPAMSDDPGTGTTYDPVGEILGWEPPKPSETDGAETGDEPEGEDPWAGAVD